MEKKKIIFWTAIAIVLITGTILVIKTNSKKSTEKKNTVASDIAENKSDNIVQIKTEETPNDNFVGNQGTPATLDVIGKTGYSKSDGIKVYLIDSTQQGDARFNPDKVFKSAKKDEFIGAIKECSGGKVSDGFVWANASDLNFK
mgnify:CR=1 FL=1